MIELKPQLFESLRQATPQGLRTALQQAVMLEHATIPTYLYALYSFRPESLRPDGNLEAYTLLRSVVLEEMVHMSLACNLLNAVGGAPAIDDPANVPKYPGPLPGAVESGLVVGLRPMSRQVVHDTFMVIEEPEDPHHYPVRASLALEAKQPLTIGQVYAAIRTQIEELGPAVFTGDPARQVSGTPFFPELTPVTDVESAVNAIDVIVEQGEGTSTSPLDQEGELAHYYKFAEIWHGKRLVPVKDPKPGEPDYAYAGAPIHLHPAGIWPAVPDPHRGLYPKGSAVAHANDTFNYTYTALLKTLHATFNGHPDQFGTSVGVMESMKEQALALMSMEIMKDLTAGPTFEYQPLNP
jgi:hypothetical protein